MSANTVLTQDFTLGYTYTRSTGPVVGHFLTQLRKKKIVGIRASDGNIIVPPVEYDPVTAEALSEFVQVQSTGSIQSWCWVSEPRQSHPFDHPFAWALVLLDGADTPILHAVDTPSESHLFTGQRVQIRWADTLRGHISDIVCFDAIDDISNDQCVVDSPSHDQEPVTGFEEPVYLDYNFTADI